MPRTATARCSIGGAFTVAIGGLGSTPSGCGGTVSCVIGFNSGQIAMCLGMRALGDTCLGARLLNDGSALKGCVTRGKCGVGFSGSPLIDDSNAYVFLRGTWVGLHNIGLHDFIVYVGSSVRY